MKTVTNIGAGIALGLTFFEGEYWTFLVVLLAALLSNFLWLVYDALGYDLYFKSRIIETDLDMKTKKTIKKIKKNTNGEKI